MANSPSLNRKKPVEFQSEEGDQATEDPLANLFSGNSSDGDRGQIEISLNRRDLPNEIKVSFDELDSDNDSLDEALGCDLSAAHLKDDEVTDLQSTKSYSDSCFGEELVLPDVEGCQHGGKIEPMAGHKGDINLKKYGKRKNGSMPVGSHSHRAKGSIRSGNNKPSLLNESKKNISHRRNKKIMW